ncbi:MAG TPA: serine hydrolase domain-containing protein [Methylomirabilota bacterium]|nr:serine hydrolase domain-containing protein [Methylomirabilota bacterium]
MSGGGLSRARLDRLRAVMAGHVERGDIPGLATLISRRGEVHVDAIGVTAADGRDPMRRDTLFRIASMTKPIAAAAAMLLVEECRLRLDEPVDRFLPELADRRVLRRLDGPLDDTVPALRPLSLRDLLTLRMGFGYVMDASSPYPIVKAANEQQLLLGPPRPQNVPAPDEWIRRIATLPLMHQPGQKWMYDLGLDVLGVLIARAAGRPLDTFLRERLFEPLGMTDTSFSVPAARIDRLATSYWSDPASGACEVYDPARGGHWSRPPAFPAAASGLVSTVDDYLAFGQMLLHKGRHGRERILSRPSVEAMTTDQLTPDQKAVSGLVGGYFDTHGWGFGLSMVTRRDDGAGSVGQFGWDGGLGTSWRSDPQEDLVGILMTQRAWTSPTPPEVCRDFWTGVYQAIDD